MEPRVVQASTFKQQCLALLDQVAASRVPIIVTKHGRPVAQLAPLDEPERAPLLGSVTLLDADDAAYLSTGEPWDADGATA